jgi:hypothetical protein
MPCHLQAAQSQDALQAAAGAFIDSPCIVLSTGWGDSGDGTVDGITTNMHITSSNVDGPVPKELCIIPTLREHDFGGELNKGHLTGQARLHSITATPVATIIRYAIPEPKDLVPTIGKSSSLHEAIIATGVTLID